MTQAFIEAAYAHHRRGNNPAAFAVLRICLHATQACKNYKAEAEVLQAIRSLRALAHLKGDK